MDPCYPNCVNLNPETTQCRHPFNCQLRADDEEELFRRCNYCGRFTSINNTSNVGNLNENCGSTEDSLGHQADHHDPAPSGSTSNKQTLELDHSFSLHVPKSTLPQESSTEPPDTDTGAAHSVRFSNFGDQCNIPSKSLRKKGATGRYYNFRTPLRAHLASLRTPQRKRNTTMRHFAPSRRFFTLSENKPVLSQLPTPHSNGTRMKHLNDLTVPGYPSLYFTRHSNFSQDRRNSTSVPPAEADLDDGEAVSDSVLPETWHATEMELDSEHHCSTGYGDSYWRCPMEMNTDLMDYSNLFSPNGSFSCRIPQCLHQKQLWSECTQGSAWMAGQDTPYTSFPSSTEAKWHGCCESTHLPPPPSCYHGHTTFTHDDVKDICSSKICEQCQAERNEYLKIRPCCCMRHCQRHRSGAQRRYPSVVR